KGGLFLLRVPPCSSDWWRMVCCIPQSAPEGEDRYPRRRKDENVHSRLQFERISLPKNPAGGLNIPSPPVHKNRRNYRQSSRSNMLNLYIEDHRNQNRVQSLIR